MNILPKKRWHVRTRENIARVRKDEQEAHEEAEKNKQRVLKAEQEARTALLRQRAKAKYGILEEDLTSQEQTSNCNESDSGKHVNFFEELEEGKVVATKTNKETELEEKEKREKYEKQIGYLTYLGQDTVESTGKVPWYDQVPNRSIFNSDSHEEKHAKSKLLHDPLTVIRKYVPSETKSSKEACETPSLRSSVLEYHSVHKRKEKKKKYKKKAKKRKKRSSSSSNTESETVSEEEREENLPARKSLEHLRIERLKREREERERTEQLLARLQGKNVKEEKKEPTTITVQQKYNSQYNPEIAKQNFASYSGNL